jgi:hypothetical protein
MKQIKCTALKHVRFEDLFKDNNDITHCIQALRQVIPAVINDSDEFLLKSKKGPMVAWKQVLFDRGYIHAVNAQTATNLLNRQFKNLNIKESSFRTSRSKVYTEYINQFQYSLRNKDLSD